MATDEKPAIEQLDNPVVVERTLQELEVAPRADITKFRNLGDKHTFYIEFDGSDDVIKCVINKGVSWQKMAKARQRAKSVVQKADGTVTAEVDSNALIKDLWNDIVVSTDPRITLADLDTFGGAIAGQIVGAIMKEYNSFAPDLKVKKK